MGHVLIIFQANYEPVEQLALAVAVGAVEGEALIRLRRLATPASPEVGHKSYGNLAAADLIWADSIVVGLEDPTPALGELSPLLNLLNELNGSAYSGVLKRALTFNAQGLGTSPTSAQFLLDEALVASGFTLLTHRDLSSLPLLEQMKQLGRAAALSDHSVSTP